MPENCGFIAIYPILFNFCSSVAEICQLGPYKMSAFDNWNNYKSNTSSISCKDISLHSPGNLLDNVWHEASATSCLEETPLPLGKPNVLK